MIFAEKDDLHVTKSDIETAVITIDRVVMAVKLKGRMAEKLKRARLSLSKIPSSKKSTSQSDDFRMETQLGKPAEVIPEILKKPEQSTQETDSYDYFKNSSAVTKAETSECLSKSISVSEAAENVISGLENESVMSKHDIDSSARIFPISNTSEMLEDEAENILNSSDPDSARDLVLTVTLQQLIDPEAVTWIKTRAAMLRLREVDGRREDLSLLDLVK